MSRYANSKSAITPTMTVSIIFLQLSAKQRVQRGHRKERDDYSYKDHVTHTR